MKDGAVRKLVFDAEGIRNGLSQDGAGLHGKLAAYRSEGFEIVLSMPATLIAKNDKGLDESIEEVRALAALCDAVVFGGPSGWMYDLHLDDKVVTPEEFLNLSFEEFSLLVEVS